MKSLGFVDYYISEWHANNYPAWIREICEKEGLDLAVRYAWAEEYVSPVDGRNTDEWCRDFGVERCDTISELCEKSDYIVILAPSNPERHLAYAGEVLRYGKNTYIDKTFAPDFETAKAIFRMADRYGTKFFSTSALRYADELKGLNGSRAVIITGGGGNFEEYIIHQIEMAVKIIGGRPVAARVETQGTQILSSVLFDEGSRVTLLCAEPLPFSVCADTADGQRIYRQADSDFFRALMTDMLRFFETGEASFDPGETLDVMKIRGALLDGRKYPGEWRNL